MNASKNEINLVELTSDFLFFLLKNKNKIFIFIFLGLIIGFVKSKTNNIYNQYTFEKSYVYYSKIESSEILDDVLNTLDQENKVSLARQLNIPIQKIKKIKKISFSINSNTSTSIDRSIESRLKLNIIATDENIIDDVNKGIINFLESNDYLKKHFKKALNSYKLTLKVLNEKISQVDLKCQRNFVSNDSETPIYEVAYITLFEKKQKIEDVVNDLSLLQNISLSETKTLSKPFGLASNLILCSFLGFIFSLLFCWFTSFFKKVISLKRN